MNTTAVDPHYDVTNVSGTAEVCKNTSLQRQKNEKISDQLRPELSPPNPRLAASSADLMFIMAKIQKGLQENGFELNKKLCDLNKDELSRLHRSIIRNLEKTLKKNSSAKTWGVLSLISDTIGGVLTCLTGYGMATTVVGGAATVSVGMTVGGIAVFAAGILIIADKLVGDSGKEFIARSVTSDENIKNNVVTGLNFMTTALSIAGAFLGGGGNNLKAAYTIFTAGTQAGGGVTTFQLDNLRIEGDELRGKRYHNTLDQEDITEDMKDFMKAMEKLHGILIQTINSKYRTVMKIVRD